MFTISVNNEFYEIPNSYLHTPNIQTHRHIDYIPKTPSNQYNNSPRKPRQHSQPLSININNPLHARLLNGATILKVVDQYTTILRTRINIVLYIPIYK